MKRLCTVRKTFICCCPADRTVAVVLAVACQRLRTLLVRNFVSPEHWSKMFSLQGRLCRTETGAVWHNWWTRTLSWGGKLYSLIWGVHTTVTLAAKSTTYATGPSTPTTVWVLGISRWFCWGSRWVLTVSTFFSVSVCVCLQECFFFVLFSVYSYVFCCSSQFGSAVKLPGSGGAVVGLCLDQDRLVRLCYVEVVTFSQQETADVFCDVTKTFYCTTSLVYDLNKRIQLPFV